MKKLSKQLLVVMFGLAIISTFVGCSAQNQQVDANTFAQKLETKNTILIDVRTKEEFEASHIVGAINYDIYSTDFEKNIASIKPKQHVMVYCRSGKRSAQAAQLMRKKGYQVTDLAGGIGSWINSGREISQ